MNELHQILFRAGADGQIVPVASSFEQSSAIDGWHARLSHWLCAGGPQGRGYVGSAAWSALIRWYDHDSTASSRRLIIHVLAGVPATLTSGFALTAADVPAGLLRWTESRRLPRVLAGDPAIQPAPHVMESRARSPDAIKLLVPLLSRVLAGDRTIVMPWSGSLLPEGALLGLRDILAMLGDVRFMSFLTYQAGQLDPSGQVADLPGLLITFRPGAPMPALDPVYQDAAIALATSYVHGPVVLRQTLIQHGILRPPDLPARIALLLDVWPGHRQRATGTQLRNDHPGGATTVICPICLNDTGDWSTLPRWRWDSAQDQYEGIKIPDNASGPLKARLSRGAYVRCPGQLDGKQGYHYLPAEYGNFGPPVVLGFVGLTRSGKTHLLAAMAGEVERNGLRNYGIETRPIDHVLHKNFLEESVRPLLEDGKVLLGTEVGIVSFADAFLIGPMGGQERAVALFDVAGAELIQVEDTKQFLDIADGLFFVIDPDELTPDGLGDDSFNTVLDLLSSTPQLREKASAAIVLNKADTVRFDDPLTRWLRTDGKKLNAEEFLCESADVYAFLYSKGAQAWTRPYAECGKATLHVASPTGGTANGSVFPRGVAPRRVLRPLVAMLAMTGVLTGPEAERVGI
jgi:hypothetical protein